MKNKLTKIMMAALIILATAGIIDDAIVKEQYPSKGSFVNSTIQQVRDLKPYSLSTERTYGVTSMSEEVDFEALMGLKLACVQGGKQMVAIVPYSNSSKITGGSKITVWNITESDASKDIHVTESFACGKSYTADLTGYPEGIYEVTAIFDVNGTNTVSSGYVVLDKNGLSCCRVTADKKGQEDFDKAMSKIKPEDNLNVSNLSYPSNYRKNYHAAPELCELADSLVKDKYSDELKVYAIVDYMRRNYAYDEWYTYLGKDEKKIRFGDDWSKPDGFITRTNVGVCSDFTNVFVIMCRHLGIPALSLSTDLHMWSAAYLNGEWVTFDMNQFVTHSCPSEDCRKEKWRARASSLNRYTYGGKDYPNGTEVNCWELRTYKD